MCFLQKTALNLVKCGLHSRTYYFLPHIGGSHPVLYFTIQATEKYSNSNVLVADGHHRDYPDHRDHRDHRDDHDN